MLLLSPLLVADLILLGWRLYQVTLKTVGLWSVVCK